MRRLLAAVSVALLLVTSLSTVADAQAGITGLRVTRVERQKLVLTWDQVPAAQSYEIVQDGNVVGTSATNWFVATDLTVETSYDFRVRANNGSFSGVETFRTELAVGTDWPRELRYIGVWRAARQIRFNNLRVPTEIRRDGVVIAVAATGYFVDTGLTPETSYEYELRLVSGVEANDRFRRSGPISTVSALSQITGVAATLIEPGVVELSWDALSDPSVRAYWVYVNGERVFPGTFTDRDATTRRVEIPKGQTSSIQVAGYNSGRGPLSEAIFVASPVDDPSQIGLRLHRSWPGTLVINWDHTDSIETVMFDGVAVGEGRHGWITLKDVEYGRLFQVSVVSSKGESVSYPIRSFAITLGRIGNLTVRSTTSTSITIDSTDFRSRPNIDFEISRDGVSLGLLADDLPFVRNLVDTDLEPGTSYTYTVIEVAQGALGEAIPRSITAITDGVAPGEQPPVPTSINSFVDNSRSVIRVTTSSPDRRRQVHQQLEIYRDGLLIAEVESRPKWEEFTYFTDLGIDRTKATTYEVYSVSSTGSRSAPATIVVPALAKADN